ncbi:MAG TPA: ABC transporter substrate-binding protein [Microlunatus sp.]
MVTAVGLPASAQADPSGSASAPAAAPAKGKILRIATSGFVDTFNPFISIYLTPTNIIRYVYESLVQNNQTDGGPTKGLADSWKAEDGGKKWVFTLQDGLKWSDGQPITSKDVQYTYQQMMTNPTLGTANGNLVSNFQSVDAPDDKTVVINLKTPQAPNPGSEIPVVPEHIWSKVKDPTKFANDHDVVGSGAYTLQSYSANQSITLKANPNFWRGKPKIDGIQYVYYTNSDAQVQALRSGDVDLVTGLTSEQYKALQGSKGITTHAGIGRRYLSISMNVGLQTPEGKRYGNGAKALQDVDVRQAIRLGTDSKTLLDKVLGGQGTLATSFIPASFPDWHLPDDDAAIMGFDQDAAKKKLDAAGWKVGSDGIREKDGKKLKLRLLIGADDPTQQSITEYFTPWMKDIGIEIDPQSTDSDTISDKLTKGDYDLYYTGWSVNPDPDYQLGINTCENMPDEKGNGGTSQDGYCDPKFDKLYQDQRSEMDKGKRIQIVRQMLSMNYTASPQVSLWYQKQLEAYRSDRFTDFGLMPKKDGIIANQAGYWGYLTVKPVQGAQTSSGDGVSTGLIIGGGVLVLLIIGGVIFAVRKRRNMADVE